MVFKWKLHFDNSYVTALTGYTFYLIVFSHAVSQVQELHRKLSEESRRADNLAFEMKKLEEKHETVMKEKEVWQCLKCVRRTLQKDLVYSSCNIFY